LPVYPDGCCGHRPKISRRFCYANLHSYLVELCAKNISETRDWLLPKQELLMSKHIDCCRLFELMLSQFIYISILIFQVGWRWDSSSSSSILHFHLTKISSQLFHHQFYFIIHGCTSGIVHLFNVLLHYAEKAGRCFIS
jgi:hypothetical protein